MKFWCGYHCKISTKIQKDKQLQLHRGLEEQSFRPFYVSLTVLCAAEGSCVKRWEVLRKLNRVNYQLVLEQTIQKLEQEEKVPTLLLHSCCAPCSSYCLEYLSRYFQITVLYYNPNIFPKEEYAYRIAEQRRLVAESTYVHPVQVMGTAYEPEVFYDAIRGLEQIPEGGERCFACYELRLRKTAEVAKERGFDYFTTTLSISPLKNAAKLNEIGGRLSAEYGVSYLYSDFKKKNGYQRSVALSAAHGLYRQNFCGCVYSKQEAEQRAKQSGQIS